MATKTMIAITAGQGEVDAGGVAIPSVLAAGLLSTLILYQGLLLLLE